MVVWVRRHSLLYRLITSRNHHSFASRNEDQDQCGGGSDSRDCLASISESMEISLRRTFLVEQRKALLGHNHPQRTARKGHFRNDFAVPLIYATSPINHNPTPR